MSTATQAEPGAAALPAATGVLDATIAATDNRKFIRDGASRVLGVRPDKVLGMLKAVWKTSKDQKEFSDQELYLGMSMVSRYLLDPVAKEIYLGRAKDGRLMIIVGIDGFIKILDRTDHYDGFEQKYEFDEKTGQMVWCETTIYSTKRSHPAVYKAFASEYAKLAGFMHAKIPWHMLRLFSLRHATRLFTPMGAVVTEEEAEWMGQASASGQQTPPESLDELTDRMEQPAKQPPASSGNGNGAAVEDLNGDQATEPEAQETPQTEPEAEDTPLVGEYTIAIIDATTLGSTPGGCDEIEKNLSESLKVKGLTLEQHALLLAGLKEKREKIRATHATRAGRGAGSNKPKTATTYDSCH